MSVSYVILTGLTPIIEIRVIGNTDPLRLGLIVLFLDSSIVMDYLYGGMIMSFLWFLIIGLVAGFLAGLIMKGRGFGFIGNLIVGVIGAILGGFLFGLIGIESGGLIGSLITALAGALILLFIVGLVKKKT